MLRSFLFPQKFNQKSSWVVLTLLVLPILASFQASTSHLCKNRSGCNGFSNESAVPHLMLVGFIVALPISYTLPIMAEKEERARSHRAIPYTPIRPTSVASYWSSLSFRSSPSPFIKVESFWRTPPTRWKVTLCGSGQFNLQAAAVRRHVNSKRLLLMIFLAAVAGISFVPGYGRSKRNRAEDLYSTTTYQPIRPTFPHSDHSYPDPVRWLQENSDDRHSISRSTINFPLLGNGRPRAALISLVRNSELSGMVQSMRQLEYRWNHKYQVSAPSSSLAWS